MTFPLLIVDTAKQQECTIIRDEDGAILPQEENCRDRYTQTTEFAGVKSVAIDTSANTLQEVYSYDYLPVLKQSYAIDTVDADQPSREQNRRNNQIFHEWNMREQNFRVGYYGDLSYTFANDLVHWYTSDQSRIEYLDEKLIP